MPKVLSVGDALERAAWVFLSLKLPLSRQRTVTIHLQIQIVFDGQRDGVLQG